MHPGIWLAIGLIIIAFEIVVPGFVIFWFGIGGLLTALLAWTGLIKDPIWQWLFFFLASIATLLLWHFVFRRLFQKDTPDDARDPTLVRLRGKVISKVTPSIPGEVELYETFHGLRNWKAESEEILEIGDEIEVVEAKGIKLIVKAIKEEVPFA